MQWFCVKNTVFSTPRTGVRFIFANPTSRQWGVKKHVSKEILPRPVRKHFSKIGALPVVEISPRGKKTPRPFSMKQYKVFCGDRFVGCAEEADACARVAQILAWGMFLVELWVFSLPTAAHNPDVTPATESRLPVRLGSVSGGNSSSQPGSSSI